MENAKKTSTRRRTNPDSSDKAKRLKMTAGGPRKRTADNSTPPTHDEIAQRAYGLYEQSGRQSGRDAEFWLEAERQLRKERGLKL